MRLNTNQKLNRVTNCLRSLRAVTDGLHKDDLKEILNQVTKTLLPDEAEAPISATPEDMQQRILKAITDGLESADAQMVRAAMDWQEDHAGREYLRELTVNITPYQVADKSLRNIVLEAGEEVVRQIEQALVERAARSGLPASST